MAVAYYNYNGKTYNRKLLENKQMPLDKVVGRIEQATHRLSTPSRGLGFRDRRLSTPSRGFGFQNMPTVSITWTGCVCEGRVTFVTGQWYNVDVSCW